ncbi:MAG TPA: radical SAM/SPASM domain-containing protein [Streptosporangiaceae bacterium]
MSHTPPLDQTPRPAVHGHDGAAATTPAAPGFLWLEITGKCPLQCSHCYAESGPVGTHGPMTAGDWRSVIGQAAAVGVCTVQFIGGEPTLHPQFADLLRHAIDSGLAVEVYTNLLHVKDAWWELFSRLGVSLATSYYSDSARQHEAITRRRGSHARTRANITEAVRRGIPLRAGIIALDDRQRVDQARAELEDIGVRSIGVDHLRQVGRGSGTQIPSVSQLCGNCGHGVAAISPAGDVWPCVFARQMTAGNVLGAPLADILEGQAMADAVAMIAGTRPGPGMCTPLGHPR